MNYLLLNACFLLVAAAVAAVAATRGRLTRRYTAACGIALGLVLALTAVFDNLMITAGLFSYDPAHLVGLLIGSAPIEDFAYPVAAAVLLPSVWVLLSDTEGGARAES
ncbi:hypothetical protein GY21_00595 [Cryobacterium roopkundense]|uniref:Lycopene cyclase domain-containing protein n=1 Tax=Cryobacterium roopkundense TaxID=1001240 RepID=A0A099JZQ5_9MICO|nr:lycopene cyclase domain-containing protein [Cryobacterium roopkundense]KGJ82873.1 hypothetical protein GY21_00595 [Cryobacterium roopkundense]MBB5640845.1 lycopene cyclase domain-containing protein [Cryobacterium roopkundense]